MRVAQRGPKSTSSLLVVDRCKSLARLPEQKSRVESGSLQVCANPADARALTRPAVLPCSRVSRAAVGCSGGGGPPAAGGRRGGGAGRGRAGGRGAGAH